MSSGRTARDRVTCETSERRLDPVLTAVAVLTAVWGVLDLAWLWLNRGNRVLVGVDGPFAGDQFQYLSWIRESGNHVIVHNLYAGSVQSTAFVHPMFVISGLFWRLGMPLPIAFLVWKPVAVFGLVWAYHRVVSDLLPGQWNRLAALLLALFMASPLLGVAVWFGRTGPNSDLLAVAGATDAAAEIWGYLPSACALALLALFFSCFARAADGHDDHRSVRYWVGCSMVAGLLAAWLHPWEGVIGLLVVCAVSLWTIGSTRSLGILEISRWPAVAVAIPLAYYVMLGRFDPAWSSASHAVGQPPNPVWLGLAVGPLAAVAMWAGPGSGRAMDRIIRIWPVSAVGASLALGTTVPSHFLASLGLPLAVLVIDGWGRLLPPTRLRTAIGAFVLVVLTVPGSAALAKVTTDLQSLDRQPHYVEHPEARALNWLDQAPAGSVLASSRLASAIPALTGHPTWFGHPNWTPGFLQKQARADALFSNQLGKDEARKMIESSGVRYVLVDCESRFEPESILPAAVAARFGCATVYTIGGQP